VIRGAESFPSKGPDHRVRSPFYRQTEADAYWLTLNSALRIPNLGAAGPVRVSGGETVAPRPSADQAELSPWATVNLAPTSEGGSVRRPPAA